IEGNHFGAHLAANADTLPGILLVHSQMTCEVDLDADPRAMSFVSAGSPTITSPVALPASVAMQPFDGQNSSPSEQRFWLVWPALIGGTILGAGFVFWLWARRKVVSVID